MNEIEKILTRRGLELVEQSLHVHSTSQFFMCKVRRIEDGDEYFFLHYHGQFLELYDAHDYHVLRRYLENHADDYVK